jgi:hypothetical protein
MASKLKRYDELSQEDKDMVDSALASIKESSNRTVQVREENQVNRDAMMKRGRDYDETPGDKNEYSNEPYRPGSGGQFEHPILRRKK